VSFKNWKVEKKKAAGYVLSGHPPWRFGSNPGYNIGKSGENLIPAEIV
jgi:hypothetical protein